MTVLEIHNLKRSYLSPDNSIQQIIDVSHFQMGNGKHLALKGESGSGKTTFLNLIAGILQAESGQILVDGEEMTELNESSRDKLRAQKIGYIFQTFNLLQGFTALENILLGMSFGIGANEKYALELLSRVGLKERADYLPKQLSVGQQQRVAVARALANRPKIVLADEPTGNLDRKRAFEALDLIREACRENQTALLLVSHDEEVLNKFETIKDLREINQCS